MDSVDVSSTNCGVHGNGSPGATSSWWGCSTGEPAVVLADAGYCNERDLLELEDRRHRWGVKATAAVDPPAQLGNEGLSEAPNASCSGFAWRRVRGEWDANVEHQADGGRWPRARQVLGLPTHLLRGAQCPSTAYETRISSVPAFRSWRDFHPRAGPDVHTRAKIPASPAAARQSPSILLRRSIR